MNMRKIAVVGGFAVGAALAFAPLASAAPVDPTLVTDTLDGEASLLNSIFTTEATLAGDSSDIIQPTTSNLFDTIPLADAPKDGAGTLDSLLYGVDPALAGPAGDPGSYDVFNGALTEFSNALNVEVYSLANGGALDTNVADYIQNSSLDHALTLANTTDAAEYLLQFGVGDLQGFFDIPSF